ncbi:uracil phosphoribosyltransferase [Oceanobacillus sp. CAU 1775]
MAKSTAKKYREKLEREGRRNPEWNRLSWELDPTTRKTKTKQEKLRQEIQKTDNLLKQSRDFSRGLF